MGILSMIVNNSYYIVCPFCGERVFVHKWCTNCGRKYSKEKMRSLLKKHTTFKEEEIDKVLEGYENKEDIILPSNLPIAGVAAGALIGRPLGLAVGAHIGVVAGGVFGIGLPNSQRKESQNENNATTFLPNGNYSDIHFVNSSIFAPLEVARNDFFLLQLFIYNNSSLKN